MQRCAGGVVEAAGFSPSRLRRFGGMCVVLRLALRRNMRRSTVGASAECASYYAWRFGGMYARIGPRQDAHSAEAHAKTQKQKRAKAKRRHTHRGCSMHHFIPFVLLAVTFAQDSAHPFCRCKP